MMNSRISKVYFGWWILVITAITSGIGMGIYQYGFSAFFKPIAFEFDLSRGVASVAAAIGALQNGTLFVLSGWLSDKFGPKWVIVFGIFLMGMGLTAMYFINSAWAFYAVWGVLVGAGHCLGFTVANDKLLTSWFVGKRGLAFGIRFGMAGIVSGVILAILSWLIATSGWRDSCLILSGVIFACLPLALYFVKPRRPEYYGLLPDGARLEGEHPETGKTEMLRRGAEYAAGLEETEFTFREAVKTQAYWLLTAAWVTSGLVLFSFNVHCIPFLTDMGIEPVAAGGMMSVMIVFVVMSRLILPAVSDRVKKEHLKYLLAGVYVISAIGMGIFLLHRTVVSAHILLILMGLGVGGAFVPLDIILRGRYFGRKAYGFIQGSSVMLSTPAAFLGPVLTGWSYDLTGSYFTAFNVLMIIMVLTGCFMCFIRIPKTPDCENG